MLSYKQTSYHWSPAARHGHSASLHNNFFCSCPAIERSCFHLQIYCHPSLSFLLGCFFFSPFSLPFEADFQSFCICTWLDLGATCEGAPGEMLNSWFALSLEGTALACSSGSFISVLCLCIWTSCFPITLGLPLTAFDWEVSTWFSCNTHGADGNACSETFMHMQHLLGKTSQILLLLPAVLPVSFWMNS